MQSIASGKANFLKNCPAQSIKWLEVGAFPTKEYLNPAESGGSPSSMPSESKTTPEIDPELPFEEALEQLESLVREMESDKVPLEILMEHYELGTRLHQVCEKRLDEAQGRIEIIRQKRDGGIELETFGDEDKPATTPTTTTTTDPEDDSSNENGELF